MKGDREEGGRNREVNERRKGGMSWRQRLSEGVGEGGSKTGTEGGKIQDCMKGKLQKERIKVAKFSDKGREIAKE